MLLATCSHAQTVVLNECISLGSVPLCGDRGISSIGFCKPFYSYRGRAAWGPLQYDGPITVELNTRAVFGEDFPIYVEIVPLNNNPLETCALPGVVIGRSWGGANCDDVDRIGPYDIGDVVPLGSQYALRLVFFRTLEGPLSSFVDCIRVTSHPPSQSTSVRLSTWGFVKLLYQDE
jgi:hypothetical protein